MVTHLTDFDVRFRALSAQGWSDAPLLAGASLVPVGTVLLSTWPLFADPASTTTLLALPILAAMTALGAGFLDPGEASPPGIRDFYLQALRTRRIRHDPVQEQVVARLEELTARIENFEQQRLLPWGRWLRAPRGLYLWGPVGRGKTFLMDGFFDVLPARLKRRYHFHELMGLVR